MKVGSRRVEQNRRERLNGGLPGDTVLNRESFRVGYAFMDDWKRTAVWVGVLAVIAARARTPGIQSDTQER